MVVEMWRIRDMISYAHQLYPLLATGDDAYRKKIRRFLSDKGYVTPDPKSGKNSFVLPESLAKYVVSVELREYFEKNTDTMKCNEFFHKKDEQLNEDGHSGENDFDYESYAAERKEYYKDLWNHIHDNFSRKGDEEYEDDILPDDYWDDYGVYLLKRFGYNPAFPIDSKNEAILDQVMQIVESERRYAYQRYFEAHKSLSLDLTLLGLIYIMLKQITSQSFNFDEQNFVEDLQQWYRLLRLDNSIHPFRKGFSEMDNRIKNPENYFTKK